MFLSAKLYRRLTDDSTKLAVERGKREVLQQQVLTQHTMLGFLCGRVNQLETERAALMKRAFNLDIATPQIAVTPPPSVDKQPHDDLSLDDVLGEVSHLFAHIEDSEARRAGQRDAEPVVD